MKITITDYEEDRKNENKVCLTAWNGLRFALLCDNHECSVLDGTLFDEIQCEFILRLGCQILQHSFERNGSRNRRDTLPIRFIGYPRKESARFCIKLSRKLLSEIRDSRSDEKRYHFFFFFETSK